MNVEIINQKIDECQKAMEDPNLAKGTASVFTRVSGYYRNVGAMNDGKAEEVKERVAYDIV